MALPPAGFVSIGPGICISSTPVRAELLEPNDLTPSVILIFGWAAATIRHLEAYSQKYSEIYPHATQIVIECLPFFLTSERRLEKRLLPVVKALEELGCLPLIGNSTHQSARPRPRVLLHLFSNGGALQVVYLGRLLTSRYPSILRSEHLVSALILDSSPAILSFRSFGLGARLGIRDPVVRYIVLILICSAHAYRLSLRTVFGIEGLITMGPQFLEALLNPRLFPWMDSKTPRLYIFSKGDKVMPWRAVQQHAGAAKLSGLNIRCEVYEESAHVAHMRSGPERYWLAIQDLWKVACREDRTEHPELYSATRRPIVNRRLSKL